MYSPGVCCRNHNVCVSVCVCAGICVKRFLCVSLQAWIRPAILHSEATKKKTFDLIQRFKIREQFGFGADVSV